MGGVSGISSCEPMRDEKHRYRESVVLGHTSMTPAEVEALVSGMGGEWQAESYDLVRKNCCSFSDAFARELGAGGLPGWVARLARGGADREHQGSWEARPWGGRRR